MSQWPDIPKRPTDALLDELVAFRFPFRPAYQIAKANEKAYGSASTLLQNAETYLAQADAYRTHLSSRPASELQQLHAQHVADRDREIAQAAAARKAKQEKKAAEETARLFYNRPEATPDYGFWTKLEYWSFEEAIALLLGKSPKVVTHKAVKRTLEPWLLMAEPPKPTAFVQAYLTLWAIAERAHAMTHSPRLPPSEVVAWAVQSGAVQPPTELMALLPVPAANCIGNGIGTGTGNGGSSHAVTDSASVTGTGADRVEAEAAAVTASGVRKGTQKFWTDAERAELRAYKDQHGTKAAAAKYGISEVRVRQVLAADAPPKRVPAHNPFGQGRR